MGRITDKWSHSDNDGIVYASDESTLGEGSSTLKFGVVWADESNDYNVYVISNNEIRQYADFDEASEHIENLLKTVCTEDELEEAMFVASTQEDAEYDWTEEDSDTREWITTIGEGGEVCLDSNNYRGALVMNVLPYYFQAINLNCPPYGEATDAEDCHEFCGVRIAK